MNTRVRWADLPEQLRRLIETETVAGNVVLWDEISTADPSPWKLEVSAAAHRWARHRGLQVGQGIPTDRSLKTAKRDAC